MTQPESRYADQQQLVAALREPGRLPDANGPVELIETHISWVLLSGNYAYKIKKAVNLGFLDFTTLVARRHFCEEELRLNRRTAPDLYLDILPLGGSPTQPVPGAQPALEYAVRMRRFANADLMDTRLQQGLVTPQHIDALAKRIARFHAALPAASGDIAGHAADAAHAAAQQNFAQLREHLSDAADLDLIDALARASEAEFAAHADVLAARSAQGFVRECHGDLHLGNIVLIDEVPVPFDGIEFNPDFRWIDVMSEIAFTVMDLLHRGHPELAWRLLNAYLEASGDYAGVAVLRFYLAYRAAVRAKVSAIRANQAGLSATARSEELASCRSYLALAQRCLQAPRPALIITHGLPGSGKTTFSQAALQRLGAIRIRSDVERKRLFGLDALESSRDQADIYSPDATRRTYDRLLGLSHILLTAGFSVIVDAAFLKRDEREAFLELARQLEVPFVIASLQAPDEVLLERLRLRQNDASEADATVLAMLQARQEPLSAPELAYTLRFAAQDSIDDLAWHRLTGLLHAG